jgi:hypothetical protein
MGVTELTYVAPSNQGVVIPCIVGQRVNDIDLYSSYHLSSCALRRSVREYEIQNGE